MGKRARQTRRIMGNHAAVEEYTMIEGTATGADRKTLIDVARPRINSRLWDALLVLGFGTLMALFAQISIPLPFTPVPITGQTFGVLLTGLLLGSRRGGMAMLVYLAQGLAGLPVFANGASAWTPSVVGVPVIAGPTAGYLVAFPVAAFAVGLLAERGWDRNVLTTFVAMVIGEGITYLFGLAWLAHFVGIENVLTFGFSPFIVGDLIKMALAALLLPSGWALLRTLHGTLSI